LPPQQSWHAVFAGNSNEGSNRMTLILDRIPPPVLRETELSIQKANEQLAAEAKTEETRLHGVYGDYDGQPLEDEISMLHLERLKRAFDIETATWLAVLIHYAPEQIDELGRLLLQRTPACAELKPKDLDELRLYRQRVWQSERLRVAAGAVGAAK
jgi:hypothetical protein